MRRLRFAAPLVAGLLGTSACTGAGAEATDDAADRHQLAHDLQLVEVPEVPDEFEVDATLPTSAPDADVTSAGATPTRVAMIGEHGHLGVVGDPSVREAWQKWQARASFDGSTAVLTLQDAMHRPTMIQWHSLPDAVRTDSLTIDGVAAELNAVSHDGEFVALTNPAAEPLDDEIAGVKYTTNLLVADRDGVRVETELDGNFVVEAFGRRLRDDGLPAQLFLLEHIPADAPHFYRVRVLSTETGEVSLPLNLRDKSQQVDERMSGLSRSQVIAGEHGLLFTLYRGTIDGTPDGDPYAFVHTLDLADGVWCLFLDPTLELDRLPGAIAVGGDRLYVASANGKIGSIPIPSISDINRSPEMDWVVDAGPPAAEPPVLLADDDGVWVGVDGIQPLIQLDSAGDVRAQASTAGWNPTALTLDDTGDILAAGDGWWTLGDLDLPDWFGAPAALFAGAP